jgi:hypothetical protein
MAPVTEISQDLVPVAVLAVLTLTVISWVPLGATAPKDDVGLIEGAEARRDSRRDWMGT